MAPLWKQFEDVCEKLLAESEAEYSPEEIGAMLVEATARTPYPGQYSDDYRAEVIALKKRARAILFKFPSGAKTVELEEKIS